MSLSGQREKKCYPLRKKLKPFVFNWKISKRDAPFHASKSKFIHKSTIASRDSSVQPMSQLEFENLNLIAVRNLMYQVGFFLG